MKNKIVKKLTAVMLGAAMMVGTLAGCGSNGTNGANASTGGSAAAKTDVPTVTIWGSGGQEVRDALQVIADMYNADPDYNTKAKVEVQFVVSGTNAEDSQRRS